MFDYHILHTLPPYSYKPRRYIEAAGLVHLYAIGHSAAHCFPSIYATILFLR